MSLKHAWSNSRKHDAEADSSVKPDGVQLWGVKALCSAIQANRALTSLNITNNSLGGRNENSSLMCESDAPLFLAEALGNAK
jgi:hypothetical protein